MLTVARAVDVEADRGHVEAVEDGGGDGRVGRVAVGGDLAEADVVEDDEREAGPSTEPTLVGAVGEAGVELGQQIDESGVADEVAGFVGTQGD